MPLDPTLGLTLAWFFAGVLGSAGLAKLREPVAFAGVVANYRLLPDALVGPAAFLLPLVEALAAAGLLMPWTRAGAAMVAAALLLLFALAMAVNLARGRDDIDCGCHGGLLRQRIGWPLVARNLVLAGAASLLALGGVGPRPLGPLDFATAVMAVLSLGLLYAAFGRLFGLRPAKLEGAS